jgi:hypothetical protein
VNRPLTPKQSAAVYRGAGLLGVVLMVIGIVAGVILKDVSALVVVATIVPGIGLLLFGIRGQGETPS